MSSQTFEATALSAPAAVPLSVRDKVLAIESVMLTMPNQIQLAEKHHFSLGVYAREIFIPKGTTLIGKIHKYQQLNLLMLGDLSVLVDEDIQRVTAPFIVVSPPGTKRIAYAHEDSIWITVHGTHETDLEKIEEHFIAQTQAEYLEFCRAQLPGEDVAWLG